MIKLSDWIKLKADRHYYGYNTLPTIVYYLAEKTTENSVTGEH